MTDDRDWSGKSPDDFVGFRTTVPDGVIVGGYVDAVGVILFEVRTADGSLIDNVPLYGQPAGWPKPPNNGVEG